MGLGNVYGELSDLDKQMNYLEQARLLLLGDASEKRMLSKVLVNLAAVYEQLGRHKESKETLEQAYNIKLEAFSNDNEHPEVILVYMKLAIVMADISKIEMVEKKIKNIKLLYGEGNIKVADYLNELARFYKILGPKYLDKRIDALEGVYKIYIGNFGENSIKVALVFSYFGMCIW